MKTFNSIKTLSSHDNEEICTIDSLASQSAPHTPEGMSTQISAVGDQNRITVKLQLDNICYS